MELNFKNKSRRWRNSLRMKTKSLNSKRWHLPKTISLLVAVEAVVEVATAVDAVELLAVGAEVALAASRPATSLRVKTTMM